jgi:hypothetical protein
MAMTIGSPIDKYHLTSKSLYGPTQSDVLSSDVKKLWYVNRNIKALLMYWKMKMVTVL